MKKFLENYKFTDCFESNILSRGERYYQENRILDIWYQDNNVYAYVDGSQIYKIGLKIIDGEINDCYCSCPYSEHGEYMCKHLAAVLYYLAENMIPELEMDNKNNKRVDNESMKLNKIFDDMQYELDTISDSDGFVNYYNGKYFVDLIENISDKIESFIEAENYNDAFLLIKHTYYFIKDTSMDGSNGEYQDSFRKLSEAASQLLYEENYYQNYLEWANDVAENDDLDDFSDAPLYAFILYVHDKSSAQKVVEILDNCSLSYGIFINNVIDRILLVHDYIGTDEAIKLCYQNIDTFRVKDKLIEYLEEENRIDEMIKLQKDDIKNSPHNKADYD